VAVATLPPAVIAADAIDPKTLDYASIFRSEDVIDQQVRIAMQVVRRSGAAVFAVGQRFKDIKKLTESVEVDIAAETRTALALLVRRNDIAIIKIEVEVDSDHQQANLAVTYENKRRLRDKIQIYTTKVRSS
jgi:hypothetical protein